MPWPRQRAYGVIPCPWLLLALALATWPLGCPSLGSASRATYLRLGFCMPSPWLHAHGVALDLAVGMPWPWLLHALALGAYPWRRALTLTAACHGLGCMPIGVALALVMCLWAT